MHLVKDWMAPHRHHQGCWWCRSFIEENTKYSSIHWYLFKLPEMLKKNLVERLLSSEKYPKQLQKNLSSFFFCLLVWKLLRKWHFRWSLGKKFRDFKKLSMEFSLISDVPPFHFEYFFVNYDVHEICCIWDSGISDICWKLYLQKI